MNLKALSDSRDVAVTVTYDGWDWRNIVTVTSPSGNTISMRALFRGDKVSDRLAALFSKWNSYYTSAKFGPGVQEFEETLSTDVMQELLEFSKVSPA